VSLICQKCQFYDNLKQTLNIELANKETLTNRIKELEADKSKLEENVVPNKENLVKGMKEELSKICDTLSETSGIMKKRSHSHAK
jgi:predicted nuclease with TOPRIM domain